MRSVRLDDSRWTGVLRRCYVLLTGASVTAERITGPRVGANASRSSAGGLRGVQGGECAEKFGE